MHNKSGRKPGSNLVGKVTDNHDGDQGNLIVTGEEEFWFPLIPVESIDATGAGDAFAAALTVTLLEDRSWQEAGAWASASHC